jgi:hypothetical protein
MPPALWACTISETTKIVLLHVQASDAMKVKEWDPKLSSFMVRSKQSGSGCQQLSSVKQPLQQKMPGAPSNATNYFFR